MSDDPAGPDPVDAEFVTVAEAARRLGISERTARRYAAKLDAGHVRTVRVDRGQSARLVRLAAMQALREENSTQEAPADRPDADKDGHGRTSPRVTAHDREDQADLRERLARAEARAELLERERNDWQEQAKATLAELRASREQQAVLLAAVKAIPASQGAVAPQDSPTASPVPESGAAALRADQTKPAGFWARLLGRR